MDRDREQGMRGLSSELLRDGVVALPEYLATDRVSTLREEVEELLASGSIPSVDSRSEAGDGPAVVGDPDDDGVVEVVGAHLGGEALESLRDEAVPEGVVNGCTDEFYRAATLDVRVATGPTDPEPYHTVGDEEFLVVAYLTEVGDVADGPFAYLHGSHRESTPKRKLGSLIGEVLDVGTGEATFHDESDGTAHPGPAGTLVVANGRGYHRFLPTREGRESVTAVIRFRPVGLKALDPEDDGWDEVEADDDGGDRE